MHAPGLLHVRLQTSVMEHFESPRLFRRAGIQTDEPEA